MRNKLKVLLSFTTQPEYLRQIPAVSPKIALDWADRPDDVVKKIGKADILFAGRFNEDIFAAAKNLKWVHATSAGIERFLFPEFVKSPVILTCERTVHDIPMAEHILAMMLGFSRQMHVSIRNQLKSRWDEPRSTELFGKTLGIIGFGSIGRYLATLMKPMGMKIIGWKRTEVRNPAPADEIWTGRKLEKLFTVADYIVVILPKTQATTHLINRKLLSRMKPSAYLINIGRGNALDENALVEVLRRNKIAGAGLDVFEIEPLPKSSPLWKLPNVIITPHIGGYSTGNEQRRINLFCNNLKRYLQHKPLLYMVDKKLGY